MFPPQTRRAFLKAVIAGGAAVSAAPSLFGRASQIASSKLTENLTLITGAGGNVVVLNSSDGLLLVNGSLPEMSADLMKFISDQFKGQRIQTVFNTDWHLEHTGSND